MPSAAGSVRLTQLSHGGGSGCKIGPKVLQEALAGMSMGFPHPDLLVGSTSANDAAALRLRDDLALVATTDFFMPIVDDAFDFGRIAPANAISDVYAMGATPVLALAIFGMPINTLPLPEVGRIMDGGAEVCRLAGIPLAGGHTIDAPEAIYGLSAMGTIHPGQVKRNDTARPRDVLVLGKPLGVGVLSAVLKKGLLEEAGYQALPETTTRLNRPGIAFAEMEGVHALTNVTDFGLLGHLLEKFRASRFAARLRFVDVPVLPAALAFAQKGHGPGAIERNWDSYGAEVALDPALPSWAQRLLGDAQTNGGLLVACARDAVLAVLDRFLEDGFAQAAVIGELAEGHAGVSVA